MSAEISQPLGSANARSHWWIQAPDRSRAVASGAFDCVSCKQAFAESRAQPSVRHAKKLRHSAAPRHNNKSGFAALRALRRCAVKEQDSKTQDLKH